MKILLLAIFITVNSMGTNCIAQIKSEAILKSNDYLKKGDKLKKYEIKERIKPIGITEVKATVPAFIGYTAVNSKNTPNDLLLKPVLVSSIQDYETTFGTIATSSKNILYPSVKLYFENGGVACYIICIGNVQTEGKEIDFINGLNATSKIDEITILVFPEAAYLVGNGLYNVQKEALKQAAQMGNRFCILDLKYADTKQLLDAAVAEFRNNIGTQHLKYGAAYTPFVKTEFDDKTMLPPSGVVAGQYCYNDNNRGFWKAPANLNIKKVEALSYTINDQYRAGLAIDVDAGISINPICAMPNKGFLIFGARTLMGNDNEWRYIPTVRMASIIEKSITNSITKNYENALNNNATWQNVKRDIENYFYAKWNAGSFAGTKPEASFYVSVGLNITMTANDIADKKMIIEYGFAPSRPAEFIITKIVVKMSN